MILVKILFWFTFIGFISDCVGIIYDDVVRAKLLRGEITTKVIIGRFIIMLVSMYFYNS